MASVVMICIRQINMDYSVCQALKRFPGHDKALIIYDICCQWIINFRRRVAKTTTLELVDSLEIMGAIGKWHLAAHIPSCFSTYEIARLAQAMSASHHQETVDKYMNDSNWRKAVRIGSCLF